MNNQITNDHLNKFYNTYHKVFNSVGIDCEYNSKDHLSIVNEVVSILQKIENGSPLSSFTDNECNTILEIVS